MDDIVKMAKMVKTGETLKMEKEANWHIWLEKPEKPIFLK